MSQVPKTHQRLNYLKNSICSALVWACGVLMKRESYGSGFRMTYPRSIFSLWLLSQALAFHALNAVEPLQVNGRNIVTANGQVMSMRGMNFGGWLMMETWIPSLEMEWHDHLPRLAQEAGLLDAYMGALEAVGEFMPDEDDQGRFTPMAYTHLEYINKVHAKLKSKVSAGDLSLIHI